MNDFPLGDFVRHFERGRIQFGQLLAVAAGDVVGRHFRARERAEQGVAERRFPAAVTRQDVERPER